MAVTPRTVETAFNVALANVLKKKHPRWINAVGAERTHVVRGNAGLQPDIIVRHPGGAPVVIETEYEPARTVEEDAKSRLGKTLESGELLEAAIAVRIPSSLGEVSRGSLENRIRQGTFSSCTLSSMHLPNIPIYRWPRVGWRRGSIDDLADNIEQVSISEQKIIRGTEILQHAVQDSAAQLRRSASTDVLMGIANCLCQEDGEQTTRMATAILANAFIFQTAIAGNHGVEDPSSLRGSLGRASKPKILDSWQRVLKVNYWPIFKIASDLLRTIPDRNAPAVLDPLIKTASDLADIGATTLNDLSGAMFQRLISDRKFLATFYTLSSSAHLLAELAVARLEVDWADPAAMLRLRIADFACGTGALLSAAYHRIAARHRRAGGDDRTLHPQMMEQVLLGADIMPAATHLTASIVSSLHPDITFGNTRIYTMPYGAQSKLSGRPHAIGSLDLLSPNPVTPLFGTGAAQVRGAEGDLQEVLSVDVPEEGFDLVIMNPPFTRPTNHESTTVPVPSFAGFSTSAEEQKIMSQRLKRLRKVLDMPVGNGYAGLASDFIDLAHVKLRPGGVAAFVLPATFLQGSSWSAARKLFSEQYRDVTVTSIASTGPTSRAFSADTGMAEVLVVGTKADTRVSRDALFVNLRVRPKSILEAVTVGGAVHQVPPQKTGHIPLTPSEDAGLFVRSSLDNGGAAGILEIGLVDTLLTLATGRLKLPRRIEQNNIPITPLAEIGTPGPVHRIISDPGKKPPGGSFTILPLRGVPTYPTLWNHDAKRETRLVVAPDKRAEPLPNCEGSAASIWQRYATRLHFNYDFRLNSQPLAACLTPEKTLGGRSWPNFILHNLTWEAAIVLWANTTLGLMSFWWIGQRQQQGRATVTRTTVPNLSVIDPRFLSNDQHFIAASLFSDFQERVFLPANEAYRDDTRQALDRAVLIDLLGLPESVMESLTLLRKQWCNEPTVHGGKSTRPVG